MRWLVNNFLGIGVSVRKNSGLGCAWQDE